ncbi:MAG: hypothetical protein HY806_01700 [Nitrospirae bacterium]|nr:hypothetical protein [Nitrospirota bacterium]
MINKELPDANVHVIAPEKDNTSPEKSQKPWRLRVEISTPKNIAIVLQPDTSLMIDANNEFERIFKEGISLAKEILNNPPLNEIYQGKIFLNNQLAWFEEH